MSHYKPKACYLSTDVSRHVRGLFEALQPWIQSAMVGEKRHRIGAIIPRLEPGPEIYSRIINRDADTLLCDCAAALAASAEWEGALIAHHLANRGWPVDVELVRACHEWSCRLMDKIMAEWRNRGPGLNPARR